MRAAAEELIRKGHRTAYLWVFERNRSGVRFYTRLGGVPEERAMIDVFGHETLCRKIAWKELSAILSPTLRRPESVGTMLE
jgi:hypothetical protein